MAWADFDIDTALERDVLQRSLQAIDRTHGSSNTTVYLQNGSPQIGRSITDYAGMSPADCVDRLKIRPLLVGVAWKVLDLLLEHALTNVGQVPPNGRHWSIEDKVKRYSPARPSCFPALEWQAVMATYAETHQLRHSLTHRKVVTDPAGSLVGIDKTGAALVGPDSLAVGVFVTAQRRGWIARCSRERLGEGGCAGDGHAGALAEQRHTACGVAGQDDAPSGPRVEPYPADGCETRLLT